MGTMNKIKTIAVAAALAVSLGASAMAYKTGKGVGMTVWYSGSCEEMSYNGAGNFVRFINSQGLTLGDVVQQPGVLDGWVLGEKLGCSTMKAIMVKTGVYDMFFR